MKARFSLTYFVNGCLKKRFFASKLLPTPSNVISFTILVTLSSFTQFQAKIRGIKLQERGKISFTL